MPAPTTASPSRQLAVTVRGHRRARRRGVGRRIPAEERRRSPVDGDELACGCGIGDCVTTGSSGGNGICAGTGGGGGAPAAAAVAAAAC